MIERELILNVISIGLIDRGSSGSTLEYPEVPRNSRSCGRSTSRQAGVTSRDRDKVTICTLVGTRGNYLTDRARGVITTYSGIGATRLFGGSDSSRPGRELTSSVYVAGKGNNANIFLIVTFVIELDNSDGLYYAHVLELIEILLQRRGFIIEEVRAREEGTNKE